MFKNDKWLLDPATDPIINMMPEEFFAHCGLAIIIISAVFGILLLVAYKWFHGKNNKINNKGFVK
jgi:integral membrane protein (TIGR01906 family)